MKNKWVIGAFIVIAIFIYGFFGTPLAKKESTAKNQEDRLIGVFVTTTYLDLFDFEGYMNEHIDEFMKKGSHVITDQSDYEGRIYATVVKGEVPDYEFPGIEGIPMIMASVTDEEGESYLVHGKVEDGLIDMHLYANYSDTGEKNTIEGTIYYTTMQDNLVFYMNPVYQTVDGQVYVTTGQGVSTGGVEGEGVKVTHTIESSVEVKEGKKTKTDTISIKLSIEAKYPVRSINVICMNENHELIQSSEYSEGMMPTMYEVAKDTAYLVVEETKVREDGTPILTRTVYDPDDDFIEYYAVITNGICDKKQIELSW